MLGKATEHKDTLLNQGMSPALVDALADAVSEFEQVLATSREGRRGHPSLRSGPVVGASADLKAVAREIKPKFGCSMVSCGSASGISLS